MSRQHAGRASAEARRRRKAQERLGNPSETGPAVSEASGSSLEPEERLWATSRSGARAGRGFRFQDLTATLVAVGLWSDGDATALVTPEGFDDVSFRFQGGSRFLQVKSRREGAGDFPAAQFRKDLRSVAEAWVRRRDAGLPSATVLLLERPVAGIPLPAWDSSSLQSASDAGPELTEILRAIDLGDADASAAFVAALSVAVCPSPRAEAIALVSATRDIPESLAEIIVSAICTRIGEASDANADRSAAQQATLEIAGLDLLAEQILATVNLGLLNEARSLGVCEAIDWETPVDGSDLNQGAHVGAAHVAAGLLVPRSDLVEKVIEVAQARRLAVVAGPSGSGKSALIYASAHATRSSLRWQQVHSLVPTGLSGRDSVALLVAHIQSLRPSPYAPIGILIDDAGRHDPGLIDRLLRRLADLPNVVTIVSIREEDRFPIPLLSSIASITPVLDDTFAEQLWQEYRSHGITSWAGWREPAERAAGLLLEYVALLTRGETIETVVGEQVRAREADPARHVELEILRLASGANQFGVAVPASAIQSAVGADLGAFTAAARRLIDEHLIVEDAGALLHPLHELRSGALARASHPFGQQDTLLRLVALVPTTDLARFLRRTLESGIDEGATIQAATDRLTRDRSLQVLVAIVSAFRADGLRRRADDWKRILDENGVDPSNAVTAFTMSRTQPRPENDHIFRPEIIAAINQLRSVPTDPDLQLVWQAIDTSLVEELLTASAADDDSAQPLLQALTTLRGIDPVTIETTAGLLGAQLLQRPLRDAADLTEALRRVAPELAVHAVETAGGEQLLLRRLVTETPWLVTLQRAGDEVDGRWIFIDEELQPEQNDAVVEVCRLALALAPTATIARVGAVDTFGRLVKVNDYALADKAIPRENLPHTLEVSENRAQIRALSRKFGAGTLTSRLAIESVALTAIITLLPEVTKAHLGDRAVPQTTLRRYEAVTALLAEMGAPAEQGYTDEIPGALGDYPDESAAVTVVRSLLQQIIPNLANAVIAERRPILAVVGLDSLIPKVGALIELDRYRYLPDPPDCGLLLDCLRQLRMIASASAASNRDLTASMRAAAGRHQGTALIAAAAAVAANRAPAALEWEAERLRRALAGEGYVVAVVPSASDNSIMSWPPGELTVTVEGESLAAYLNGSAALADAVRASRGQPERRIWIGLQTPQGYPRVSILQVANAGTLPLGDREPPQSFTNALAPRPISNLYEAYLRQARRLSAIATIIAIRGGTLIPDEEAQVLGESWDRLVGIKAQFDELTSAHVATDYVSSLSGVLEVIGAAVRDDLSTAREQTESGISGWDEISTLRSLPLLDADQAGAAGTDASIVYGALVIVSAIENDFENADRRIQELQESPAFIGRVQATDGEEEEIVRGSDG